MNSELTIIRVRSKRQAMDWSLVLASQDIQAIIERTEQREWALLVEPHELERAQAALDQYQWENRHGRWKESLPWPSETFHLGGLIWCLALILMHQATLIHFPAWRTAGEFQSAAVWSGEWWRVFTAIHLHADLAHLLANATTGVLLFGLAMAFYGGGVALLVSYLAGGFGNVAGMILYAQPYHGLGASGMVMGALGMITVRAAAEWRAGRQPARVVVRGFLAGVLLFVLLGLNPESDVVAHLGGFVAGVVGGSVLMFWPASKVRDATVNRVAMGIWIALMVVSWLKAT